MQGLGHQLLEAEGEEWPQQVLLPPAPIIKEDGGRTLILILQLPTQVQGHQVLAGAHRAAARLVVVGCTTAATQLLITVGEAILDHDPAPLVSEVPLVVVAVVALPGVAQVVEVAAIIQAEAEAEINS